MKAGRVPAYAVLIVAVCLLVQLAPAASAQQLPGEWQLLSTARWDKPKTSSTPGDGSMVVRVIRIDERGGEAEAQLELAQPVCARGPMEPRGDIEIIQFRWTFTSPIARLRPGDPIPVNVETWVQRPSQRCPNAGAFRTTVYAVWSDGSQVAGNIPAEQRNQYWGPFSIAFQPVPPGVRFNFEPGIRESAQGRALLRVQPNRIPVSGEPLRGWFAIQVTTNATRAGGDDAAFFYTYGYSAASIPGDQATQDMLRRASRDPRFGAVIAGSQGAQLDWAPDWELRWMDFNFSSGRRVRIYHATNKTNRAIRYTIYWDPDRGAWMNWEPAA